jgi:hypothetical protein
MARLFNESMTEYHARLVGMSDAEAEGLEDDDFAVRSDAIATKLKLAAEARTKARLAKEEAEKKRRAEEEKVRRAEEMAQKKAAAAEAAQRKAEEKRREELKRKAEEGPGAGPSTAEKGKGREVVAGSSKKARVGEVEAEKHERVRVTSVTVGQPN